MNCPKCEEDGVFFQDVIGWDPETIELSFICKRCNAEFIADIIENDLKELLESEGGGEEG